MQQLELSYAAVGSVKWKTVSWYLLKLNILILYDLAILLLDIYATDMYICSRREMYKIIHNSTIHSSQKLEITQMSINNRMAKNMKYIHTLEYYTAMRMRMNILHPTQQPECIILQMMWNKRSQTLKHIYWNGSIYSIYSQAKYK